MSLTWPILVFGSAIVLAWLVLYVFRAKAWYWHVLSLVVAVALSILENPRGILPIASGWDDNIFYLALGFVIVFLGLWGVGGPFFRGHRTPRRA